MKNTYENCPYNKLWKSKSWVQAAKQLCWKSVKRGSLWDGVIKLSKDRVFLFAQKSTSEISKQLQILLYFKFGMETLWGQQAPFRDSNKRGHKMITRRIIMQCLKSEDQLSITNPQI